MIWSIKQSIENLDSVELQPVELEQIPEKKKKKGKQKPH